MASRISKIKSIIEIIIGVGAIVSIILSFCSIRIANEANQIAKNTASVSQLQFIQENRPYLEVIPVKFDDGSYMEFAEIDTKQCEIGLKYKINNVGKVPATDILVPQLAKLSEDMIKNGSKLEGFKSQPTISLAPGEHVFLKVKEIIKPHTVTSEAYLRNYKDGSQSVSLEFQVIYRSEINKEEIYSTKTCYKIFKNNLILESYKHTKINDPVYVEGYNKLFHSFSKQ
ncbi:MAG: hypothetical protein NTW12_09565 [Deltaproteobacteria bacterium]|nr:hypothetical protein [Deltaproteobacteria bacterium]